MQIRNVAIVAHVDHGKTTLVDAILKQTGVFRSNEKVVDRVMDSDDLERERGITILSKNASVVYKDVKINIVDTPGHSDFGGEVERILDLVDGAVLVVDAFEGPMPQTRFVLQKALGVGLKPLVVINKIDRPDQRANEVLAEVFDLLVELGADDNQLDFPTLFCSAKLGNAALDLSEALGDTRNEHGIFPLLDEIVRTVPSPQGDSSAPMQLLVSNLSYDDYVGRIAIGRVRNGVLSPGQVSVVHGGRDGFKNAKIAAVFSYSGLKRVSVESAATGDIVAVTGIEDISIGDTIADPSSPSALEPVEVDEPTLKMVFGVNDSPFAGREGKYLTSRHLRDRLYRELRTNVSLRVSDTASPDRFEVAGRGELHLSILIENMRREGYELSVSKPGVIFREDEHGITEPIENLSVDVPSEYVGITLERLSERKADLTSMTHFADGRVRLEFLIPARGLVGFRSLFTMDTNGKGIMYYSFCGYGAYRGDIPGRNSGAVVAWEKGSVTAYAIANCQERAKLFVQPGDEVYAGMIIGENSRSQDMDFNICKRKHLTNMRSSTADIAVKLEPALKMSLEEALAYIEDDELVEITPKAVRLRKRLLDKDARKHSGAARRSE